VSTELKGDDTLLNYCSSVWIHTTEQGPKALESVQKFALRLCFRNWSAAYHQLLV